MMKVAEPMLLRRSQGKTLRYDASLPAPFVDMLWHSPGQLLSSGKILRSTDKLRTTALVEWEGKRYVMKHYGHRSLRHALKQLFVGSPARQSFVAGCRLADAGVLTPRPVAAIDGLPWAGGKNVYLVYPYAEGCPLAQGVAGGGLSDKEVDKAVRAIKSLWRQLMALGVGLRDANTGNFIVSPQGEVWLIDLDDCQFHRLHGIARGRLYRRWVQFLRSLRRTKARRYAKIDSAREAASLSPRTLASTTPQGYVTPQPAV